MPSTEIQQQISHDAEQLVLKYTVGAMGIAAIPIPLLDLTAVMATQLKMLHDISLKYNVPFPKESVKTLVATLISGSVSATVIGSFSSLIKAVPIIGQISGFIGGASIYGATTYALGKVFIQHFESGGSFLNFDPKQMQAHFQELLAEGKQFIRKQDDTPKNTNSQENKTVE